MITIKKSLLDTEIPKRNTELINYKPKLKRNKSKLEKLPKISLNSENPSIMHSRIESNSINLSTCDLIKLKKHKRIKTKSLNVLNSVIDKDSQLRYHELTEMIKRTNKKKKINENKIDNIRRALDRDLKNQTKLAIIDIFETKINERIQASIKILKKYRNQNHMTGLSIIHAVLGMELRLIEAHIDGCENDYNRIALVNTRDQYSRTCLHYATSLGQIGSVEMMMAIGSDPKIKDAYGRTPLHYAALQDNKEVIETLISSFNKASKLHEGASEDTNYYTISRLLKHKKLKKMANIPKPQVYSLKTIPKLVRYLDYSMLNKELQRHIDRMGLSDIKSQIKRTEVYSLDDYFNNKDDIGRTALHIAALCDKIAIIRILLDNGADPDIKDINGSRPLELTSSRLASSILISRMKSSKKVSFGKNLFISENESSGILTKDLLSMDDTTLLSFQTEDMQENYLHIAVKSRNLDAISLLLQRNLNPLTPNKFG